jgi:hypothetical protein
MPQGIDTVVENGYAQISFLDISKKGPVLQKLVAMGSPIQTDTSDRRTAYRVPEGNARAAGLIDDPKPKVVESKPAPEPSPITTVSVPPPQNPPAKKAPPKKTPAKKAPPTKVAAAPELQGINGT